MTEKYESAEEISARWNKPTTTGTVAIMAGGEVPFGENRATASSEMSGEDGSSSRFDAQLPAGVDTLTTEDLEAELARRQAAAEEEQDADSDEELKGQALNDALEARGLSKSGSAEEKRQRVRDYDAEQDDDEDEDDEDD
jgi:hypothetical protein